MLKNIWKSMKLAKNHLNPQTGNCQNIYLAFYDSHIFLIWNFPNEENQQLEWPARRIQAELRRWVLLLWSYLSLSLDWFNILFGNPFPQIVSLLKLSWGKIDVGLIGKWFASDYETRSSHSWSFYLSPDFGWKLTFYKGHKNKFVTTDTK